MAAQEAVEGEVRQVRDLSAKVPQAGGRGLRELQATGSLRLSGVRALEPGSTHGARTYPAAGLHSLAA